MQAEESPKIQEIEDVEIDQPTQVQQQQQPQQPQASTKNLVPLVTKWIELGTLKGVFTVDVAYALFISLQLLSSEPHTAMVDKGKVIFSRTQSVANLMVACKAIQQKGKIFTSVEQGAQVYETIQMLHSLVAEEVQNGGQDDQSHRACTENDLVPETMRLKSPVSVEKLVGILEALTRKGFELGAIDFEKNQVFSAALMLLKKNPGDMIMSADQKTKLMSRLDAFKILVELLGDVMLKGDILNLSDVIVLWPSILHLEKYFKEECGGGDGGGGTQAGGDQQTLANEASASQNHKKRKTEVE